MRLTLQIKCVVEFDGMAKPEDIVKSLMPQVGTMVEVLDFCEEVVGEVQLLTVEKV